MLYKLEKFIIDDYLNPLCEKSLSPKEKKDLIKHVGLTDNYGRLSKSSGSLNAYWEANKMPYKILVCTDKKTWKLFLLIDLESFLQYYEMKEYKIKGGEKTKKLN